MSDPILVAVAWPYANAEIHVGNLTGSYLPADIFARFQRLHHPEHKGLTGSGLGIYISRQIVLRHGGEITAESEPGKWAEFRFRIPLQPEAPLD